MLTSIPGGCESLVLICLHADGALSRRHPGTAKHGFGATVGSTNWSYRTEVSSTPHVPAPPWCLMPCPAPTVTTLRLKSPAQLVAFWSQNCGLATAVVPGAA